MTSATSSARGRTRWLLLGAVCVVFPLGLGWWLLSERPADAQDATPAVLREADENSIPHPASQSPSEVTPMVLPELPRDPEAPGAVSLDSLALLQPPPDEAPTEATLVVVDANHQPVLDARVEVWSSAGAPLEGAEPRRVSATDAQGRVELTLESGRERLFVSKPGVGTSGLLSRAEVQRQRTPQGEALVVLQPLATLTGLVLHQDERPAPGARVLSLSEIMGAPAEGRTPAPLYTDGDGRFELQLDSNAQLLLVAQDGDLESHPEHVQAAPGLRIEVILRFPGRWSVGGTLMDAAGAPVPHGLVTLWRHHPGYDVLGGSLPAEPALRLNAETEEEGRFHIDVPRPGEYILLGASPDSAPSDPVVTYVSDMAPRAQVQLFATAPGSIRGRLVGANGLPLPDVTVRARPAHLWDAAALEYSPTVWRLWGEAAADTDADGRFELAPLHPAGSYIVFCRPESGRPDRKLVVKQVRTGSRELLLVASELELTRGWVTGTVVSDVTGQPVEDFVATLIIEMDGRAVDTEESPAHNAGGAFRFEGLAPGYRYALRVSGADLGTVELPWWEAGHHGHHVDVRLPGQGALEVLVTDARGRALELATVTARRQSIAGIANTVRRGHTDYAGKLHLARLPPGRYEVSAEHGAGRASDSVTVTGGTAATLRLTLGG